MHPGSLIKYWHTVRHLKASQIRHQLQRKLLPPRLLTASSSGSHPAIIPLIPSPSKPTSYLGDGRFCFLNVERDLGTPIDWSTSKGSRLWQYNLHYFNYLHQEGMTLDAGLNMMRRWIQEHPVGKRAVGWEPYPMSLRLVNWIKFLAQCEQAPQDIVDSIGLQTENLERQIEYHLLGNHLWANGKALWFAGEYLGRSGIADKGRKIILQELSEQFLEDGGHFELSPMYHSIVLEDLLDLINLSRALKGDQPDAALLLAAGKGLSWLGLITGGTGLIPLLNDSAHGQAATCSELSAYAARVGVEAVEGSPSKSLEHGWQVRDLSGYQNAVKAPFRLIFDTAPLGPDYIPGHAHCDMLSVLLDFEGQEVFSDTGVFEYEETDLRHYSRSTFAHNTVSIDGYNQAEIWKSFRMGRRCHPRGFQCNGNFIRCGHNGFAVQQKGSMHSREVRLLENGFEVTDEVAGPGNHRFESFLHCSPGARVFKRDENEFTINDSLTIQFHGEDVELIETEF